MGFASVSQMCDSFAKFFARARHCHESQPSLQRIVSTSPACGWHAQVLIYAAQFERFTSKDFAVAQRFKDRLAWRRRDTIAIDGVADGDQV